MAALFGAVALFCAVLFVRALGEREIRTGLFTYVLVFGATAFALWRLKRWGRSVALLMGMANFALGVLSLAAVTLSDRGPVLGPVIVLVISGVVTYLLTRPVFELPADRGVSADD